MLRRFAQRLHGGRLTTHYPPTYLTCARLLAALVVLTTLAFATAQGSVSSTNIELILDASGSMFNRLDDGRYRIVAAKQVLADLIAGLPDQDELNVGLRVYGSSMRATAAGACEDTVLKVAVEGFARQELLDTVKGTQALGATPIALSLEQAVDDFPSQGRNIIVLITDGIESCRTDLREVAQMVKDRGIDLRIIGFDLDANAARSFDGLGTFENATTAAELLAALTRAVEVEAVTATYRVTVTLTREGAPATEGATVAFGGAIDNEQHSFSALSQAGGFGTELAAGSYTATVGDAFSAQPLQVGGLVVTAEGPNDFTFELAPVMSVTLSVADEDNQAGAITDVAFEGAPPVSGFVAVAPADADDSVWLSIHTADADASGAGAVELQLPDEAGDYQLRYYIELPDGGWGVIGRLAITVSAVTATLEAPAEAPAGSRIIVSWTGPGNRNDFITIVRAGSEEGTWNSWVPAEAGEDVILLVPDYEGDYEIRYVTGGSALTLASAPLRVVATEASLSFVDSVRAGSSITVAWVGPGNPDDFLTIVPAGSEEGTWNSWVPAEAGEDVILLVPDYEGDYEVRYVTGGESLTLARRPLVVTPATATLEAPASVNIDEEFQVVATGPFDPNDFITIVPVGSEEGSWEGWVEAVTSPIWINAPSEPGAYEIRYATGQSYRTLARIPLTVR